IPSLMVSLVVAGCSGATTGTTTLPVTTAPGATMGSLPQVPALQGDLRIDVVYPGEGAAIAVSGSTFIFGNIGRGDATLTINGAPVEVAANGAWLAYLPIPSNG